MPFYKNKNNLNLYYDLHNGHEEGTPIIMLHGFGSSASFFQHQLNVLKSQYKILLFDAEGHGRSEKSPEEDVKAHLTSGMVEDLLELLYILKIDRTIGIIGHSLVGGSIAQQLAILFPKQIKFLILLNSGTMIIDNPIRNVFWNLLPQMVRMNFNQIISDNLEILLDKTIPFIKGALLGNRNYHDFYHERLDGIIEQEIFDMIQHPLDPSSISCPTLVIGAELDNYTPLWMSKDLAKRIPNSEFDMITMTGHFGPSQRYEAYNEKILKFLEKLKIQKVI